jgi:hypothetical protein
MRKFLSGFLTWFPIAYILPIGLTKFGPSWFDPPPLYFAAALIFGLWMGFCYWFLSRRTQRHLSSVEDKKE